MPHKAFPWSQDATEVGTVDQLPNRHEGAQPHGFTLVTAMSTIRWMLAMSTSSVFMAVW